jgi:hypothetical protein
MKRAISIMAAVVVLLVVVSAVYPQIRKDAKTGLDRIEGIIQSIDRKASTITVRQKSTTEAVWQAVYNDQTKFTYRNTPASLDELKEGQRVVCLGKSESASHIAVTRVDIRTK